MRSLARHVLLASIPLLVVAPAEALASPPPGSPAGLDAGVAGAACPLYWHPGEPVALFPHSAPPAPERAGRGLAGGQAAALDRARRWIEVAQPATALAVLDSVGPLAAAVLYRLAALDDLGRWDALDAALEATPAGSLPAGCGALHDRWAADAAEARRDAGAADAAWARLAAALPELGAYVDAWRLAAAARVGAVERGEAAWNRLAAADLPAETRQALREWLAELYDRAGRSAQAARWHETLAGETRGRDRARHWIEGARLADQAGDRARADRLRGRLVREAPGEAAPVLSDPTLAERLGLSAEERARACRAAGLAERAEAAAAALLEAAGTDDARQAALVLRAEARTARGDRPGAEADYAAFLSRWPASARAPDVQYARARLALVSGDGALARQRLDNFVARWPEDAHADDALYLMADSWQDDWRLDPADAQRAQDAFDRLVRTHPASYYADRSTLRAAHLSYALGHYADAERRYADYRGRDSAREARYWLARTLEAEGRGDRAREILRGLAAGPDDYYALLSRARLGGRRPAFEERVYRPAPPAPGAPAAGLAAEPAGRRALALLAMGERRWAASELTRAVGAARGDRQRLDAWAGTLAAWGFPGLTLRAGTWLDGATVEPWTYPAGFADAVDVESRAHGLDAYWVLALIRQESLFDADAVSSADAHGLMQILPATGRALARETGYAGFEPAALHRPAVNLHLGAQYLEDQLARFGGFWPAVLAAYNGGPDAAGRWWEFPERSLDPELWIDRIPYKETREYVRQVVVQYAAYRSLYAPRATAAR